MRSRIGVAAVVVTAVGSMVVSACGAPRVSTGAMPTAGAVNTAAVDSAAQALLDGWSRAHPPSGARQIFSTDELLAQRGDWTSGPNPEANKLAFTDGLIETPPNMIVSGQLDRTVVWADGANTPAEVLSPAAALEQDGAGTAAVNSTDTPLVVTAVVASSVDLATTRGHAVVPAWEMSLRGTPVRVVVVAASVAGSAASPPTATAGLDLPGVGVGTVPVGGVSVGADGRTLTVRFTGAMGPATELCGADYTAETVADPAAIAIVVYAHGSSSRSAPSRAGDAGVYCNFQGTFRQVSTVLAAPWAGRPILDVFTAQPVSVN